MSDAQLYFTALNRTSQLTPEKIDAGLKFIQSGKLDRLRDKNLCEKVFVDYFGGEYAPILNVDNLRNILRRYLGADVYSWYEKKFNCSEQIKHFAEENYRKNFVSKVIDKVRSLTAEEAQKYLEELIAKDTLLGIRVLKNS